MLICKHGIDGSNTALNLDGNMGILTYLPARFSATKLRELYGCEVCRHVLWNCNL